MFKCTDNETYPHMCKTCPWNDGDFCIINDEKLTYPEEDNEQKNNTL